MPLSSSDTFFSLLIFSKLLDRIAKNFRVILSQPQQFIFDNLLPVNYAMMIQVLRKFMDDR